MASYSYFHIDAFANGPFKGNQAAIMPMDAFLPDDQLQAIAAENLFAETAYIVRTSESSWDLRWFTPAVEVPLCGHATLAAAHVLFNHLGYAGQVVHFDTRQAGRLSVVRGADGQLEMDFPASRFAPIEAPAALVDAIGRAPCELWTGPYMLAVFEDEDTILGLAPDTGALKALSLGHPADQGHLICATAAHGAFDVLSRVFVPGSGIAEDPATGSAHCMIGPLFAHKLGKTEVRCFQAFPGRGAEVTVRVEGDRVKLLGRAVTVVEGEFHL